MPSDDTRTTSEAAGASTSIAGPGRVKAGLACEQATDAEHLIDFRTGDDQNHPPGPGPVESSTKADLIILDADALNSVIQEVFAVGMALAGCARTVEPPAAAQLIAAIDGLDRIIAQLRCAALGGRRRQPPSPPVHAGSAPEEDLDTTLGLLDRAARSATRLTEVAVAEGTDASHLLEAAHSIYRAMITLRTQSGATLRS
jgi:hypothetical protein